ncbi:MAG: aconitate hydratase [Bacteroidales bacterium]
MILDIDIIRTFYRTLPGRMDKVKKAAGRPLTLTEKILFNHLSDQSQAAAMKRKSDYAIFSPDRVAMQDATAQMALLQFMVTGKDQSEVPASVHCDHLIKGKLGADKDLSTALGMNREVYDFLRSVSGKYNIGFWDPGAGIIHQVVLENYAFPGGMMIGTDSHTPTAGGLGMIAPGVGGADAVDAMTGMGWELKLPGIIGVKLTGRLNGWTSAKDVILRLTGMLTVKGGTGSVIEYFGEGTASLSCTGKATICNMGAETGATCSVFGLDESMIDYLVSTGREEVAELARANRVHLTADQEVCDNPSGYFDQVYEIDLSALEPYINGPFTPDRAVPISMLKEEAVKYRWPLKISAGLIGSCTNSSFEDLSRAASVIENALQNNLSVKSEFIIIPGSERIRKISEEAGLMDIFRKAGAKLFANACGPCIGQWDRGEKKGPNSIIHSFNRNFASRADGNPQTHAFVASPEIVAAMSVAGNLMFNPLTDMVLSKDGMLISLPEPSGEVLPPAAPSGPPPGYRMPPADRRNIVVTIDPGSERLQILKAFKEFDENDFQDMPLLIKVKGKCTTDHISMAGPWLKYRGHLENISGNYMTGAVNAFNDGVNSVLNIFTGKYEPVPEVAGSYRKRGLSMVVVGEDNFGEGSSREHAAMEPRFFGVRAIIVKSFARIHETNLKKQGVLTLTFATPSDYERIREDDWFSLGGFQKFAPGSRFLLEVHHSDETVEDIEALHSYNENQISWFRAGSALNLIRKSNA